MTRPLDQFTDLVSLFFTRAEEGGDARFLLHKAGGEWIETSWREAAAQVAAFANSLRKLGLQSGDRVLLVSENRPEWAIADLAIMTAGGVTVPAYTSNGAAEHAHVLADSGARLAIVSGPKLARPLLEAVAAAPACRDVIAMAPIEAPADVAVHDWAALIAGGDADVARARDSASGPTGDSLACLIYTSGTGGAPRGVMQPHRAILHNVRGCAGVIYEDFPVGDDLLLSFLPLAHAYEHSAGLYLPIGMGAPIAFAESIEKLAANMVEVRPTVMIVVPRLFEVLRARIVKAIEAQGRVASWLLHEAVAIGERRAAGRMTLRDRVVRLAVGRLLVPEVRARFGGRLKALVSGGAPLNAQVGRFFESLGITLLQGYGQTESGPVVAVNRPAAGVAMETVGPPLADTEVRIAPDGEILVRGPNVMLGYWRNPDDTARTLVDGWLHTGDVGHFDDRGRIVITDRKKDLIVNDKGENIAPQKVEGLLTARPEIAQAMVAGDRRPYLVALLVAEAGADETALQAAVDAVNARLPVAERVRRFVVADQPMTVDNGMLTPTLKIRRHAVRAVWGERLDALYKG